MWAAARRWVVNRLAPASSTMLSGPPATSSSASRGRSGLMKMKEKDSKKHLYLVLDDLNRGCSVHKLDIQEDDGGGGLGRQLLEDPVTRLHFPTLGNDPHVGVLGSHVVGIGSGSPTAWPPDPRDGVTVAFDLKTAALTVLRDLPTGRRRYYDVHLMLAVGNRRMYMIESGTGEYKHGREPCAGAMHCLEHIAGDGDGGGGDDDQGRWDWWDFPCLEPSLSSLMRWRWNDVHDGTPFHADGIMAHALHPGGRAFFVSLHDWWTHGGDDRRGTFSYDTGSKERRGRWARQWRLGAAVRGPGALRRPPGRLARTPSPPLQRARIPHGRNEQLFHVDRERHIDAKIVPIDGGFCLVEILTREGVHRDDCLGEGDKCVLRLTTFRAKYAPDGELTIAARRPAGHYHISRYIDMFKMQAFWM
ncbi:unnamed protein product [Urochloa decumbens]|uniref:Uncharacterized protein n=1 Tax=Urochloa decumbens TaxID=240449 RepID=A0ABC9DRL6_9POAL